MSYRIQRGERLHAALNRIANEELSAAQAELQPHRNGAAVHNLRKSLKRLRALLRCLRVAFPERLYRREIQRLSAAGRSMSPQRDVQVQLALLTKLNQASQSAGRAVHKKLLRQSKGFARRATASRAVLLRSLQRSRQAVSTWPLRRATPDKIATALKKTYRQGFRSYHASFRRPTPEALHQWRKKVKALGYGFDLFHDFLPGKLTEIRRCCETLGDELGYSHDLSLVLESLRLERALRPSRAHDDLARRLAARRHKLTRRAFKLGERLYREKPGSFKKRLDRALTHAVKN